MKGRRLLVVRWEDAVEDETDDLEEESSTCIRTSVGWLVHDQANRLVLCTEVVRWHDGTELFYRLTINPDSIVEKREV